MARPQKTGLDYFPHDTDSISDEKVDYMRMLYKNDGYAFYFITLERIYKSNNFELNVSDAETKQILCRKVSVTISELEKMILSATKIGLFDKEEYEKRGVLTSSGIKKRAEIVVKKREKMQNLYNKRVSEAETLPETTPETPQRKEKKSKVNNNVTRFFSEDTPEYTLAVLMLDQIKSTGTTMKDPDLNKWSESFDKIHRIDKRGYDWLFNLIIIIYKDNFWKTQIRSPDKLREQINSGKLDRLVALIGNCMSDEDVIKEIKNA